MDVIVGSMKAAAKAAEAVARFCKTMMRIENPSDYKETREEQFVGDWFVTRKMDKEPTYADAIEWADKTMIDKACEWMELRLVGTMGSEDAYEFLTKFRKAMEE